MRLALPRRKPRPDGPPIPFVVGMNRSGTTLLRMMLDAHPELVIPPETHFVPDALEAAKRSGATPASVLEAMKRRREWGDFDFSDEFMLARLAELEPLTPGGAVRTFFEAYAERAGKPRWGDKTPRYVTKMRLIERHLPEARFVHVIRDGRDVALSVLDRTAREDLTAADVAGRWRRKVRRGRRQAPKLRHYVEIRYEDLVLDTVPTLERVCEFLELPWSDSILEYHERSSDRLKEMARPLEAQGRSGHLSTERRLATHAMTTRPPDADRVQRWRRQMSEADRVAFEQVASDLLTELGYPVGEPVDEAPAQSGEAAGEPGAGT